LITGIGIDIIETDRIREACQKPRFLERVFTVNERNLFASNSNSPQMIAGSFAAKEAVSKALGTGIGRISWQEIEILRDSSGKPYVEMHGRARDFLESIPANKIWVSITHLRSLAAAQAIIEKQEG
jgi:holo-[acyl-carrier protein] synthase